MHIYLRELVQSDKSNPSDRFFFPPVSLSFKIGADVWRGVRPITRSSVPVSSLLPTSTSQTILYHAGSLAGLCCTPWALVGTLGHPTSAHHPLHAHARSPGSPGVPGHQARASGGAGAAASPSPVPVVPGLRGTTAAGAVGLGGTRGSRDQARRWD